MSSYINGLSNLAAARVGPCRKLLFRNPLCYQHETQFLKMVCPLMSDSALRRHACRFYIQDARTSIASPFFSCAATSSHHGTHHARPQQSSPVPCRNMSDNLLGYSPMARPTPTSNPQSPTNTADGSSSNKGPVWGVDSNTAGGGVWAQTSAKRDKLNELLTELNNSGTTTSGSTTALTLDDAASVEEKLDLEFADGLKCIAQWVDGGGGGRSAVYVGLPQPKDTMGKAALAASSQLFQFLNIATSCSTNSKSNSVEEMEEKSDVEQESKVVEWNQLKFEATMNEAIRILSTGLPPEPPKKTIAGRLDVNNPLCYMREFTFEGSSTDNELLNVSSNESPNLGTNNSKGIIEKLNEATTRAFSSSVELYRTILLRSTAKTLLENWDILTAVTSGDIDRAAVSKVNVPPQRPTINAANVQKLFEAYASGSCQDWVKSWWQLLDSDADGRLDEEEMVHVIDMAIQPVHLALGELMNSALNACPVRSIGLESQRTWFLGAPVDEEIKSEISFPIKNLSSTNFAKLSWRNRRAELRAQRSLSNCFQSTLLRHFRDQVEIPHRLRCIYAWAEKSHQDNKIDSILVDASEEWGAASSIVGRKRYVELAPKISYDEFQKVQQRHFAHLDRVGEEIVMSFKEDLWVLQGKGRQNKELRRDCFLFLLCVSLVDLGIGMV